MATRAKYGAAAYEGLQGKLPTPWPRTIGPNAMKYLQEVVDSGLTSNLTRTCISGWLRKNQMGS